MRLILYLLLLVCFVSCKSTHKITETDRIADTLIIYKCDTFKETVIKELRKDSIIRDSVIITIDADGKTIGKMLVRDRFVRVGNTNNATTYQSQNDSVSKLSDKSYNKSNEAIRKTSFLDYFRHWKLFATLIVLAIIEYVIIRFFRKK